MCTTSVLIFTFTVWASIWVCTNSCSSHPGDTVWYDDDFEEAIISSTMAWYDSVLSTIAEAPIIVV